MKLMNKIINRINDKFDKYFEIINFSFPVLFCVELEGQVKIGFVNDYKPSVGKFSFILANSEYDEIINCIENDTPVINLFKGKIYKYTYNKREIDQFIINTSDINQYLPSEELTVQGAFNCTNIRDLLVELKNQQKQVYDNEEILLHRYNIATLENLLKSYNKTFSITYKQFKDLPRFSFKTSNFIHYYNHYNHYNSSESIDSDKLINAINDMIKYIDSAKLFQNIKEVNFTGYTSDLYHIKYSKHKEDIYEQNSSSFVETPNYKFIPDSKHIVINYADINKVA